jgi:hypothetical protein
MRVSAVPFLLLLAVAFVSAAVTTGVSKPGLTRTKGIIPKRPVRRTLDTDPPVEQPHGMIVTVQSYCLDPWNNTYSKAWNGGWKVAPPALIYGARSGAFVEGFEGEADPGTDHINATVTYQNSAKPYVLEMAFAAVQGEWEYELVSSTLLNATLASASVGRKAVYTIIVGDPYAEKPRC